jgi:hypothetical protein
MKINKTFYIFLISIVLLMVGVYFARKEYFDDVPTILSCSASNACPEKSRCMNGHCISMTPNVIRLN